MSFEEENDKQNFFSLSYNSFHQSSIFNNNNNDINFLPDSFNLKNDNLDNEIDTTLYKTNLNEINEKKNLKKIIKFKTEKKNIQNRFDYLIKDTKIMINNQLIEDLNLILKNIGKNYKFFKMNSKFTSNTNYKKNIEWFDYTIRELLNEFLDKKEILESLNYLKNNNKHTKIINEINKIFDKSYEDYIFQNYSKLNEKYIENIKIKYSGYVFNNCEELKDLIKKIKNSKPYEIKK